MNTDILDLKSQNIVESAVEAAKLLESTPLFYVRTKHNPEELVETLAKYAKSSFAWECVSRDEGLSTLILQKKTSCCGMCH